MALADAGARVLVHYRNAAAEAKAVVADIHKSGGHADIVKADLAVADGPGRLVQNAREFFDGRLVFYQIAHHRTGEFSGKTQPDEIGWTSARTEVRTGVSWRSRQQLHQERKEIAE